MSYTGPLAFLPPWIPRDFHCILDGYFGLFSLPSSSLTQTVEMWVVRVLAVLHLLSVSKSIPQGFPASGNGLWFNSTAGPWGKEWLPVGNGYLAAMVQGGVASEVTQLNIESLWSGGPFSDSTYNGGNKRSDEQLATAQDMQSIRQRVFNSTTGNIDSIEVLTTPGGAYGSYAGAGYLITNMNTTGKVSGYARWLDLDLGIARTSWTQSETTYLRSTFCSHPLQACIQHTTSTSPSPSPSGLPGLTYAFSSALESGMPTPSVTCLAADTILIRGTIESGGGMLYELIARVRSTPLSSSTTPAASISCTQLTVPPGSPNNATISILPGTARDAWVTWVGGTEYSADAGSAAHSYSFRGPDPHNALLALVSSPLLSSTAFDGVLAQHVADYKAALTDKFALDLGQKPNLALPTDVLKAAYAIDGGDPYLEWVLFNYGRYMLVSSARGALPANLQGKWANGLGNAWSADYHSNINIQMNYWAADMTNMDKDVARPLFDYFEKTWAPRGSYTAQVLYNISRGWVVHNEMNIFGHTGMKGPGNTAQWANYPEANAWMMLHVWDHFDFTNDVAWFKAQGWPLLKGVAGFHLDKLVPDLHFKDGTLVVNPCNSPEQNPITFGCAHAQQLIWQLLNAIEKGFQASGDTDTAFLEEVRAKRARMDKGLHIGSWGQLQEWKLDQDSRTDTHRHLSHLIGLYPGYAIAEYDPALQGVGSSPYSRQQVLDAATVTLTHRGNGTGPDGDAGWEKAWRAACWAQLGDAKKFYHILTYAIQRNFAGNLFSVYNPDDPNPIFQIDANLAYPSTVLNALVQAPDVASYSAPLTITLLPALPEQWSQTGFVRGVRIRGGMTLDLAWAAGKPSKVAIKVDQDIVARPVRVVHAGRELAAFTTSPGMTQSVSG